LANIRTAALTAGELGSLTEWPQILIEDYLNIVRNVSTLSKDINGIGKRLDDLAAPTRGMIVTLKGAGASTPTVITGFNVSNVVRISMGVYQVTLTQSTISGTNIEDISTVTTGHIIAPNLNSDLFYVRATFILPGLVNVEVFEVVQGTGTRIDMSAYDLQIGDTLSVNVLSNTPGVLPTP